MTLPHHTTLNFLKHRITTWRERAAESLEKGGGFHDLCIEAEGLPILLPETNAVFRRYQNEEFERHGKIFLERLVITEPDTQLLMNFAAVLP